MDLSDCCGDLLSIFYFKKVHLKIDECVRFSQQTLLYLVLVKSRELIIILCFA